MQTQNKSSVQCPVCFSQHRWSHIKQEFCDSLLLGPSLMSSLYKIWYGLFPLPDLNFWPVSQRLPNFKMSQCQKELAVAPDVSWSDHWSSMLPGVVFTFKRQCLPLSHCTDTLFRTKLIKGECSALQEFSWTSLLHKSFCIKGLKCTTGPWNPLVLVFKQQSLNMPKPSCRASLYWQKAIPDFALKG